MSLENLIIELEKIHAMHPNANVVASYDAVSEIVQNEVGAVRYDNLSKNVVIELD